MSSEVRGGSISELWAVFNTAKANLSASEEFNTMRKACKSLKKIVKPYFESSPGLNLEAELSSLGSGAQKVPKKIREWANKVKKDGTKNYVSNNIVCCINVHCNVVLDCSADSS